MKKIILASASPRRKEILEKINLPFKIRKSGYEEKMDLPLSPRELVKYLSREKAKRVASKEKNAIIIAADTIVVYKNRVLGKPKTKEMARRTLRMLSGKTNYIITGVTILDSKNNHSLSFCNTTKIYMNRLPEKTINAYIKTGDPMDKAGAYAIQGLGTLLIKKINGDFFNCMGLPLAKLSKELGKFGVKIL